MYNTNAFNRKEYLNMGKKNKDTILYIDDEKENLDGFRYSFRKDFNILVAVSAEEGFRLLKENEVKVIISDQRMPGITGVEFFENIIAGYPDVIRIIMTGFSDVEAIIEAVNKGRIYHYITKPWKKSEIKLILNNAIESYNLRRENKELIKNLKETNKYLKEAKEKAEVADKLKTAFLANMSHEIRTPLNAIVGFSQFLTMEDIKPEKRKYYGEIIYKSTNELLQIIQDILDISKIESGQIELIKTELHLPSFLQELYAIYSEHKLLKLNESLEYNIVIPPNTIVEFIYCDVTALKQILGNLIVNAFKYTAKGSVELGYKVITGDINTVVFFVKDTGIGIPEDKFEFIFERFRKIEDHTKLFRGNGLGLTISRMLAELHGGKIYLESEIDKGSVFYCEIPVKKLPVQNTDKSHNSIKTALKFDWTGKTILVVEDNQTNFEYIKAIIENTNIEIIHAISGSEAIEFCKTFSNIDLVLMDIQLPEIDGYVATKSILGSRPELPVIAQTAYATPEDKLKADEAGCIDYFSKPIDKNKLLIAINKALF